MKWYTYVTNWLLCTACLYVMYAAMAPNVIWLWKTGSWVDRAVTIPALVMLGILFFGWLEATAAAIVSLAGGIAEWRQNRTKRNPPVFLSTVEVSPSPKLLTPGEQASDRPEELKQLQDGQ